tara:strand:+ start:2195 stop:2326 length:132 start_codon:yes stop_codon:yes gene_type:complete
MLYQEVKVKLHSRSKSVLDYRERQKAQKAKTKNSLYNKSKTKN